jgi:hypothetical protein
MENLEGRRPLHRPFTGRMVAWRRVQKCTRTEDIPKEGSGQGHVIELGSGGAIYDRQIEHAGGFFDSQPVSMTIFHNGSNLLLVHLIIAASIVCVMEGSMVKVLLVGTATGKGVSQSFRDRYLVLYTPEILCKRTHRPPSPQKTSIFNPKEASCVHLDIRS